MARKKTRQAPQPKHTEQKGITRITVANFKSIVGEQSIEIRPLTILAGANSSGKSSMMQPLLLLKQTLEAQYDPGALLLDGPNVKFSQAEQLLARGLGGPEANTFSVGIQQEGNADVITFLRKGEEGIFSVEKTIYKYMEREFFIKAGMTHSEINEAIQASFADFDRGSGTGGNKFIEDFSRDFATIMEKEYGLDVFETFVLQSRCFLNSPLFQIRLSFITEGTLDWDINQLIINPIHQMLHLPGLRGNPQRTYPLMPLGPNFTNFSGTFENYTASVISYWQKNSDQRRLSLLNRDLTHLALTNKIEAHQMSGIHVELLVNRLFHGQDGTEDMVNIADVGFGVSQALPVVVALHAAEPGQLVYIEQPEIHLHPRAQAAMAEVLADAAIQGKRVVIETHSDLVLSGIQTLVAEGKLPPELVKLHWFEQLPDGSTKITSSDLDQAGAFGDWPEDFHKVILAAENRYLDAAEARLLGE